MCRSYLQSSCTELNIYILIADNRNRATYERYDNARTLRYICIARVVRIKADCRIAQDSLWAGCSNDDIAVCTLQLVTQVVEFALRLLIYYLLVRQSGLCRWVPMHHTHATVNLALAVEVAEDRNNALGTLGVHREASSIPIARCAQLAQLLQDDATVLLLPLPSVSEELLTSQGRFVDALSLQLCNDLRLGSNRSVVGTRHPASILAEHTRTAHQHILQGVVEHMSHMQHTRNIWWRNYNSVRLASVRLRVEQIFLNPVVIPFTLNLLR